ncbi:multiple epidermal growth factor-like domains protein 9 isoform X2 [Haliotis rufescens]|uniref:multiple epidermal growth factor-like domains protein 9 isoform X2 n=1 Tax=Haliotis rufescens TaxID=6454 RepID=UPI001EB03F13|nr:multiple epidermal growth factor-like domains protein 9 isoform X2 [Haliotis rufescens]
MANLIFIFILVLLLQCRPTNGCRSGGRRYYKEGSCTSCAAGCKDGRCNDDGSCSCKAQWAGRGCKTRCRYGYYVYARMCKRCSTWCQSRGCNPDDGTCKCRLGWAGRRCTIQMPVSAVQISPEASTQSTMRPANAATLSLTDKARTAKPSMTGSTSSVTVSLTGTPRTSTTLENVTNTEPEQGGELLKSAENQTWPYILIYSLTPVVIISCTILGLSLAIKRRSRKTSTNSGAKVPSTTDGLGAGQAVQLADVSEAGEDRHYDVIHEPVTQVDASDADKPDHVTDENVYAVPFENRDVNFYENTCQSTDGNMYAIPTANMDTHVYEGIKTRTKISRK